MAYVYDDQNIFAKILRAEIPNTTVYETEHTLAFRDIAPKAPDHVLVIPKGPYVTFDHFCQAASDEELTDFFRASGEVCKMIGAAADDTALGFRAITNAGQHGVQEVPHFHLHILSGRPLGRMVEATD
ncbi:histidine triad nucleotide-binding protein [Thioclava sp. SK-1]|uniref:HIT domain-containing protein n=1 Tax=Thioclava sp. SK-1 TaxID=1889770 RepID=UPI0008252CDB|nr:HIT domain-containing protein [Thioclava sp. SK-1]OCX66787.1 histidine triad nucleotide-binding protein [Thioclava sp. SK-1]